MMDKSHLILLLIGILINFSHINADVAQVKETAETELPDQRNESDYRGYSRILNGFVSKDEDYAYHVSVMGLIKNLPVLLCGGAIIDSRYILTAAHCVVDYTSDQLVVRSGGPLGPTATQPHKEERAFRQVLKIMIPRQYSKLPCRRHQHDIAILKIQQGFDLSDVRNFKKANLPCYDSDFEDLTATLTGYGADYGKKMEKVEQPPEINNYYLQFPNELRTMPVTIISNESCQDIADVVITESSICARPNDKNMKSCFQDDGGPLVYAGTVIGILNSPKCEDTKLEVFTRVSYYLHFIKSVLEHRSSCDILTF